MSPVRAILLRAILRISVLSLVCGVPCHTALADEMAESMVLATYKLANDASTASGMVVSCETEAGKTRRFLVTANHVLEQMVGDSFLLVSRERHDDGTYRRNELRVPMRANGERLWRKHAEHDIGVLLLPESLPVTALPWTSLATEELLAQAHVGDAVQLAVFPERSEANDAGFPILRDGMIASFPLVPIKPYPAFLVDTTTWTGDSGGPVMHQSLRSPSGGPLIIGIVRGMRNIVDATKESRFVERRIQYPLGVSEVLHAALARPLICDMCRE